jgi:YD repeat-containing protein
MMESSSSRWWTAIILAAASVWMAGTAPGVVPQDAEPGEKVAQLIRELASDDVSVREKASDALLKLGKAAEPALRKAAESSDPEVKTRAQTILDKLKVLKLDDQGRVLVERDAKGWNVEYTRDDLGNVIKKAWVNPHDGRATYVRSYTYEVATGRVVEETDAAGRRKRLQYGDDGKIAFAQVPEGFLEEADQVAAMPPPSKKGAAAFAPEGEGGKKSESKEK